VAADSVFYWVWRAQAPFNDTPSPLLSTPKVYLNYKERRSLLLQSLEKIQQKPRKKRPPARTPEARESQMIAAAIDLAEKQLLNGTASSQVITHFLKLGSTKERIEKEILEKQKELISAKTEALKSAKRVEELYKNALDAMRAYSGLHRGEEID
jgi:hypothetical protein